MSAMTWSGLVLSMALAPVMGCPGGLGNGPDSDDDNWLDGTGIAVEVDGRSSLRVYLRDAAGQRVPLTASPDEADPTGWLIIDGEDVDDFVRTEVREEAADDGALGPGRRLTVEATSDSWAIRRTLILETADDHPGVILARTRYSANEDTTVQVFVEHHFALEAVDPPEEGPEYWSFQGGAEAWGEDYVLPLRGGGYRANEHPIYGGVPYCDIWSRGGGLGIGSASAVPRRLAIPVKASDDTAWVSIEWPEHALPAGAAVEVGATLLVAHTGDFYAGARAYANAMAALGVAPPQTFPDAAYLQHWETYGYGESWTVADITSRLSDLPALGIGVVTIDSGWYEDFLTGDYVPDPALFPDGDADVRALTDAIHAAGLKAKLWWEPGNAEFESQLAADHPDWLVRDADGEAVSAPVPGGDADPPGSDNELTDYALCPAVPEVVEFHRQFVRKAIEVWGFDGFKMDYIYAVRPCYAAGHGHDSPDDSIVAYPELYRAIAEAAQQLRPDALLNVCNCGVAQNYYLYPYENQLVTSDPIGSRQMRVRTKVQKAFFGPTAPILCDHVELSVLINADEDERDDDTPDFASCLGVGAVLQTKYTEFESSQRRSLYEDWLSLGRDLGLASGEYLGALYVYGFDQPEAHAVRKGDDVYYGFFVEPWGARYDGPVELRGLGDGTYQVEEYMSGAEVAIVQGPTATLQVTFENSRLLRAVPLGGQR